MLALSDALRVRRGVKSSWARHPRPIEATLAASYWVCRYSAPSLRRENLLTPSSELIKSSFILVSSFSGCLPAIVSERLCRVGSVSFRCKGSNLPWTVHFLIPPLRAQKTLSKLHRTQDSNPIIQSIYKISPVILETVFRLSIFWEIFQWRMVIITITTMIIVPHILANCLLLSHALVSCLSEYHIILAVHC